jgi:hypothetical protein
MNRFAFRSLAVAALAAAGCQQTARSDGEGETAQLPSGAASSPYARPGFVVLQKEESRLWVFREGAKELAEFQANGELAKHVTRPGAGPGGMTVKAPDSETIIEYAVARPGFVTAVRDGRIWVFRPGSKDLAEFEKTGEPAKSVTRPGAGPLRMTVKGPDADTITEYVCARPGFVTRCDEGRLWVFREGAKELAEFQANGELAKHVTRPGAGPGGMTLKAPDNATLNEYVAAVQ